LTSIVTFITKINGNIKIPIMTTCYLTVIKSSLNKLLSHKMSIGMPFFIQVSTDWKDEF